MAVSISKSITGQNVWTDPVKADSGRLHVSFSGIAGGSKCQVQTSQDATTWTIVKAQAGASNADDATGKFDEDTGALNLDAVPGQYYRAGVATGDFGSGTVVAKIWG